MRRFSSFAIAAAAVTGSVGSVGRAHAQSQAEIAAKLNDEGKELMYADKYAEAAKKFAEAVARVPEAKYFVNLCAARLQEGKLDEALTACDAVKLNNPSPEQQTRADKLTQKIEDEAKKQGLQLHAVGGGGGQGPGAGTPPPPDGRPTYTPAVGRPLDANLVVNRPEHRYTWTFGIDLFGGGGQFGQPDYYGNVVGGLRLKGDVLIDPARRIGIEGYIQASHFSANSMRRVDSLDIGDLGIAGYKHICLLGTPRLCVTPLAGFHLSLMSPAGEEDGTGSQVFNYAGVGGRLEVALDFAFGQRYEHVLQLAVGANLYTKALSGPSADDGSGSLTVEEAGLDRGGATGYIGLGYTYRFNSPIGATPLIILE